MLLQVAVSDTTQWLTGLLQDPTEGTACVQDSDTMAQEIQSFYNKQRDEGKNPRFT